MEKSFFAALVVAVFVSGCVSGAGEPKDFRQTPPEKNRRFDPKKSAAERSTNKLVPVNLIRQAERERRVREEADEAERIQRERGLR